MSRLLAACALFAMLAFGAAAQTGPSISLGDAWARATMTAAQAGAIYVTITDHGEPDRLIGASTPVAGKAELHQSIRDGNVMKMRPVAALAVTPAAPTALSPGGYHIMLTELKKPLVSGQTFPLTLTFEKAGAVQTTVTVRPAGASGGMDMGGASGGMDMGGASGARDMGGAGHDMQHMTMPGMTKP
jgi:copper(I)-binding protein